MYYFVMSKSNILTKQSKIMKQSFSDLIQKSDVPVLVDFYATWCGPCQMMSPVLKNLAGEFEDKVKIIKIDVDKNPQAANNFQVRGVPTFVLFDKGQSVWRQSGAIPEYQFKQILQGFIK